MLTNDFHFNDLIIRNCSVDDDGGGMYIRGIDQLAMSNIRLQDNMAASSGGGARFSMSTISRTGGEVTNNRVSGTQITIEIIPPRFYRRGISSREGSVTLENIQISGNSVVTANSVNKADGGGLSLFSSDNVFSNVEISNNTAAHSGGGLQVSVNRNNRFSAQGISVMNNQAGTDGGGVSLNFSMQTVSGCLHWKGQPFRQYRWGQRRRALRSQSTSWHGIAGSPSFYRAIRPAVTGALCSC